MVSYFEFECESCGENWEMYARALDYGDGSYDLVAVSDGPGLSGGSTKCPECGHEGELI